LFRSGATSSRIALVGVVPSGLAGVVESESAQHAEETGFGPAAIINGIDAGAAQVADGFVGLVGHEDGNQFAGTMKAGEFDGVLFVGFDVVTSFGGDERWGDDGAMHLHPGKEPGDPHAASSGFVADGDA